MWYKRKPAQESRRAIGSRQGIGSIGDWEKPAKARPKDFLDA